MGAGWGCVSEQRKRVSYYRKTWSRKRETVVTYMLRCIHEHRESMGERRKSNGVGVREEMG